MIQQRSLRYLILLFSLFFNGNLFPQNAAETIEKDLRSRKGDELILSLFHACSLYNAQGKYDKSLQYSDEALRLARQSTNPTLLAEAHNTRGSVFAMKMEYDQALKHYLEAYKFFESQNDKTGLAATMSSIGNMYRGMRNYEMALKYLKDATKIREQTGDSLEIANCHVNLGAVYYDNNQLEPALRNFQLSLNYYKSVKNEQNSALLENNIGSIYNELKQYDEAIVNYKSALETYNRLGDSSGISMCLANIGNVYNESGNTREGIAYTNKSMEIAKRLNDREILMADYIFLIEGWSKKGDYKRAFHYQNELLNLKDTLYDLNTSKSIAEMQTRFDTERKEKHNQILMQQNELQSLNINRQRIISYASAGGLILVGVLAFFIFRGYRQKKKANEELKKQQIEIVLKNSELEKANSTIHEKNKDITDSIRYAKRLQSAILKPEAEIRDYFSDAFVFFRPKDIVSGDFYWFEKFGSLSMVAAADCTGHGVPGAFMSIIGCNLLSQAVNEYAITQPAAILNSVNKGLSKVLQQKTDKVGVSDGMDIALCALNREKMVLEYSGAYNPLWIVRDGKLMEFKGDKFPVGAFFDNRVRIFNNQTIPVQKDDMIYLFSDGYADQFGGPAGKKFKYKQLQQLFLSSYTKSGNDQKQLVEKTFEQWIGDVDQIDDVLVIGIRV